MTAFSTSNLPPNIDTVEKLVVWGLSVLNQVNDSQVITTIPNETERVVTVYPGVRYPSQSTDPYRFVALAYLPLQSTFLEAGGDIWQQAKEITNAMIPSGFTS